MLWNRLPINRPFDHRQRLFYSSPSGGRVPAIYHERFRAPKNVVSRPSCMLSCARHFGMAANPEKCANDLKKAVELNKDYIESGRKNKDFDSVRKNPKITAILGGN